MATVTYEAFTQIVIGAIFTNSDLFYVLLVVTTAIQFKILGDDYKNTFYSSLSKCGVPKINILKFKLSLNKPITNENQLTNENEQIKELISSKLFEQTFTAAYLNCVKRHQRLILISHRIKDFLSPLMLACISVCMFYLIFMAYCIVSVITNID